MNKKYFFLCGYMRCGNTVLTSILNQNPDLNVTPNSVVPEIVYNMYLLKEQAIYKEKGDEKSFDNVMNNVLHMYHKDNKAKNIIERGPWSTPANYELLKYMGFLPSKFIYLVRPLREILESFCRVIRPKPHQVENFCDYLMHETGPIGKALLGLQTLKNKKEKNLMIINYHDFCNSPEKIVKDLYKFLDLTYYKKHTFKNLKQVDDRNHPQTTIRTDEVKLIKSKFIRKVPEEIIKKYEKTFISS